MGREKGEEKKTKKMENKRERRKKCCLYVWFILHTETPIEIFLLDFV